MTEPGHTEKKRSVEAYPWAQVKLEAIIFDFDGTLIDSEKVTDLVVSELLAERDLPGDLALADLDLAQFHGVTWEQGSLILQDRYPDLAGPSLAPLLQQKFHAALLDDPPPPIPGAVEAVRAAAEILPVGLVSSSNRESVEHALNRLGLRECFSSLICAEDCTRSKPDPQSYELAAKRLGVRAKQCLVFEDSRAGLQAARAAGMWTVAITYSASQADLDTVDKMAHFAIADFRALPSDWLRAREPVV